MSKLIPLNEILTENSSYNRVHLKNRLIKNGLLTNKCSKCKILPEWNGKLLVLQLEHKNGINNDNRIENLELLCPNCHSQTETFAGKNIKKTKDKKPFPKCPHCLIDLKDYRSETCKKCRAYKTPTKIDWPSLEELQKRLETTSFSQLGRELNISGNAIRKRIKKLTQMG